MVGACTAGALANYTATQGAGTNFNSFDVGGVKAPGMVMTDAATGATDVGAAILAAAQAAIPAGANLIGKVGLDQTTPGTTNGVQVNAALPAGTNTIGGVNPVPATSGGLSVYFVQPAASDNHVVIKAGAGQVYKISVTNNSATINYLRLYNATTGFNGCNSATNIVYQMAIPASTSGTGYADSWDLGMAFATGISICVTSGYATTDTTNATASALSVNVGYK